MAPRSLLLSAALALGSLQQVFAQTSSKCNPVVNGTNVCPVDEAFSTTYDFVFNSTEAQYDELWTVTAGTIDWTTTGANFTINEKGDSPTIRSNFYIFGGRVEFWIKAAPGTGIISSVMLLSDDLDEIDLEFLGGNGTAVQTNFFGKGVNNYTWESDFTVSGGTVDDYHNYTIDWKQDSLEWYIDGEHVRTLTPEEANNTYSYPQTPCRIYVGPWAGGDPDNAKGTIAWAGGETDYDNGPFTMAVRNIHVTDYGNGTAYNYTDSTGLWTSIESLNAAENSTAATAVSTGDLSSSDSDSSSSISEKFNSLSTGSKAAIVACSGAAALGVVVYALFYCMRQRKRGQQEAALAAKQMEDDRLELEGYKAAGVNPDGFSEATPTYDPKTGVATRDVMVADYSAAGAQNEKMVAGATPLLTRNQSYSPPGTPNAHENAYSNPYTDGFSPVDHNGQGFSSMHPAPSGPLPGVPDRSFSNGSQHGGYHR